MSIEKLYFFIIQFKGLVTFLFSVILFLYKIFEFDIKSVVLSKPADPPFRNASVYDFYYIQRSGFSFTVFYKFNQIAGFVLRDFVNVFVLIVLNVLIYLEVRKSMKKKAYLQNNEEATASMKSLDNSLKLMVFLTSLNSVLGRVPIAVWSILDGIYDDAWENYYHYCFVGVAMVYVSYLFHFVLYFFTNKLFRKIFKRNLSSLVGFKL
jgi:hypothetical protein